MKNFLLIVSLLFATSSQAAFFGIEEQILRDTALIKNGGFENGDSQWNESGSSVLSSETSGANWSGIGAASGSWDATAASETLTSDQAFLPNGLLNSTCHLSFKYKGGDSNITARVIDDSLVVVGSVSLTSAAAWTDRSIAFTCPSSGSIAVSFIASADAAIIYLDKIFLGEVPDISVAINPIIFTQKQSVGSVGSVANAQGPLVDGDFPNPANAAAFDFNTDTSKTAGTATASFTANGSPSFNGKGFFGQENILRLSGTGTQYMSSTDPLFDSTSFTILGWINQDDYDPAVASAFFESGRSNDNNGVQIYTDSKRVRLRIGHGASLTNLDAPHNFLNKTWHHIAVSFNNSSLEMKVYLDGQLAATGTSSAVITYGASDTYVGSDSVTRPFNGLISQFAYESDVFTEAQINAIYSKRFTNHQQIAGGHVLTNDSFPFADLTDKVSYWNLNDLTDGSGNAKTLTNNGGVTFGGLDIFGQAGIAEFDGINDSFSSTDPQLTLLTSGKFTVQGLFNFDDVSAGRMLITLQNEAATANRVYNLQINSDGSIGGTVVQADDTFATTLGSSPGSIRVGKWYHLALVADGSNARLYIDGVEVDSVQAIGINTNPVGATFRVGARKTTAELFFKGRAQGIGSLNQALSDSDIKKLASARLDLPVSTPPESQQWIADYTREDSQIKNEFDSGFLLDKKSAAIYIDSGLDSGDVIEMKLKDTGFSPTVIPVQKFNAFYSSDPCVGSECSINHNLPGRPANVEVWHEVSLDRWERQDPSTCQATATQLVCVFSGIANISAANRLNVIASMSDLASVVVEATTTNLGTVKKNSFETKFLIVAESATVADIATNGNASNNGFNFTGLVIGNSYRLHMNARLDLSGHAIGDISQLEGVHNGVTIAKVTIRAGGTGNTRIISGSSRPFIATASTVTFDYTDSGGGGTIQPDEGTFISLETLNN